jgi:hypothetical protein
VAHETSGDAELLQLKSFPVGIIRARTVGLGCG